MQQCLPLTVLKLIRYEEFVLMAGSGCNSAYRLRYWNFNSLEIIITLVSCNSAYRLRYWNMFLAQAGDTQANACCNSAYRLRYWNGLHKLKILGDEQFSCNSAYRLRYWNVRPDTNTDSMNSLQQCLPLTVLKRTNWPSRLASFVGCNSAYRLRYWNLNHNIDIILHEVATVLTAYGIET